MAARQGINAWHKYIIVVEWTSGCLVCGRYHRMDGSTAVGARARLVDDFNANDEVFVFLLTTKVGGLGINLTGADRYPTLTSCPH
jgi:hypothetical protein